MVAISATVTGFENCQYDNCFLIILVKALHYKHPAVWVVADAVGIYL